jgi:hypothetical protein
MEEEVLERHPENGDEKRDRVSAQTFKKTKKDYSFFFELSSNASFMAFLPSIPLLLHKKSVSSHSSKETQNQFPCRCKKKKTMTTALGIM